MIEQLITTIKKGKSRTLLPLIQTFHHHHSQCKIYSSFFSTTTTAKNENNDNISTEPNPSYVDLRHAPASYLSSSSSDAVVYNSFTTNEESNALINDITQKMKRRRYEKGHWDAVISKYKEVELSIPADFGSTDNVEALCDLSETSIATIERIRNHLQLHHFESAGVPSAWKTLETNSVWLPSHAIDLSKDGILKAHVDSIKFSGKFVAGLSLLSDCIMRLQPATDSDDATNETVNDDKKTEEEEGYIDLYLEQGSLYVLSGKARFEYTHELLPSGSIFTKLGGKEEGNEGEQIVVERDHRFSVIFRDAKL